METDELQSRINEMRNLIEQIGDVQTKYSAGVIDDETHIELDARKRTYLSVLALAEAGEYVDDDALNNILDEMRIVAAEPTQEEINAANIDYLLMIGGEE